MMIYISEKAAKSNSDYLILRIERINECLTYELWENPPWLRSILINDRYRLMRELKVLDKKTYF